MCLGRNDNINVVHKGLLRLAMFDAVRAIAGGRPVDPWRVVLLNETVNPSDIDLRLRELLMGLADTAVPVTYQQAAEALGLAPPRTIQRVSLGLEAPPRENVAAGHPMIAALVVSRHGDQPRQGFFELAVALGRFPADLERHEVPYQEELGKVLAGRSE